MQTGAITQYIDVAQLALYVFWIFFAGLIYYLHQENKREGYPLEADGSGTVKVQGWPPIPAPKTYLLRNGETRTAPTTEAPSGPIAAKPTGAWIGAPLEPTGNPMLDGVGPGAYANRPDVPDQTLEGLDKIVPLRIATDFGVDAHDTDPRGLPVYGADGKVGGTVTDCWVDRSEMLFRYLELEVAGADKRRVLLPINFTRISANGIKVASILSHQFGAVPGLKNPDQITLLEEEKVMAYYGAGTLYAEASRAEPIL
jgi:photosynthetic reaction center H subunit